CAREDTEFDFW
nr:immunoglobulin heavy chain junction region [Macaca mulatta]MOV49228.1 immunoglobulin heavy chain junction region [Macaca mulatta]MOV49265.1 immunoglobulin heavy chain junction region [Macaca mulatta]MOV50030.1 immunoglobulin heavy chain junction region [Macaca mulatta]MOV50149.1 immunoglobulin heavy chain junction region [Macaca mulatta]